MDNNARNVSLLEMPALTELVTSTPVVERMAGETLFRAGDPCLSLPVIESGHARVYASSTAGQQTTLYQLEAGAVCPVSLSSLLQHGAYPVTAVANMDVKIRYISGEKLLAIVSCSPEIFRVFLDTFVDCLSDSVSATHQLMPDLLNKDSVNLLFGQPAETPDHSANLTDNRKVICK
ncbi:hypothetical protein MNBD_GAMMA15-677 [hydrothermal vent metagenome]|uniref:Cyclic nucleotide-binding domain-containing protein n=1 Tax=hydrothermal vent metagenome TaxID=652676 RepID=A0A3B0YCR9_9ZZZZ